MCVLGLLTSSWPESVLTFCVARQQGNQVREAKEGQQRVATLANLDEEKERANQLSAHLILLKRAIERRERCVGTADLLNGDSSSS